MISTFGDGSALSSRPAAAHALQPQEPLLVPVAAVLAAGAGRRSTELPGDGR